MRMRKWFKSTVAMIALVAMLMENAYSVYAVEGSNDYTDSTSSEVTVSEDAESQAGQEESATAEEDSLADQDESINIDVTPDEEASQEEQIDDGENGDNSDEEAVTEDGEDADAETSEDADNNSEEVSSDEEGTVDDSSETADEEEIQIPQETAEEPAGTPEDTEDAEEAEEEVEVVVEKKLAVNGNEVNGIGYSDVQFNVDASALPKLAYFGLKIVTDADVYYMGEPVNDGYIPNLSSFTDTVYLSNLEEKEFTAYFVGENVSAINADYSITSEENGTIDVIVSLAEEFEVEEESEQSLVADGNGINGIGYDEVSLSMDYIANLADDNDDDSFSYLLFIDSDSDVTANGQTVGKDGVQLDNSVDTVVITGLEKEEFFIRAQAVEDEMIAEPAKISFSVISEENATAAVSFEYTNELAANKRVYTYEDSKVSVTATLEVVDAVPDDAEFVVKEITPSTSGYNYDAYVEAINNESGAILGQEGEIAEENIALYDIAFFVEEDGRLVEFQPEEGSVTISINFKNGQLEEIGAQENEDVKLVHLPLDVAVSESVDTTEEATGISADDINVEVVGASASVNGEAVEFTADSFSVWAFIGGRNVELKTGTQVDFRDVLGDAIMYGVSANTLKLGGHMDSNFAAGDFSASCNITQGVYTGSHNPGNDILAKYVSGSGFFTESPEGKTLILYTTNSAKSKLGSNIYSKPGVVINTDYSESQLKSKVAGIVGGTLSSTLANESNYMWFSDVAYQSGNYILDLTKGEAGTYYIRYNNGQYANTISAGGPLRIKINSNQNVVFNIPDEKVKLQQFVLEIDGKECSSAAQNQTADVYAQKVVWNLFNATDTGNDSSVLGVVLAPKGHYEVGGTSTGWLVANSVHNNGEWHMVWQDMPSSEGTSASFGVKKVFENAPATWPEFTFKLEAVTAGAPMPSTTTISVKDGNVKSFGSIDYDAAKTAGTQQYVYKVSEVKGSDVNTTYDATVYYVRVNVVTTKDVSGNRTASATVEYSIDNAKWSSYDPTKGLVFTNTYVNKGSLIVNKKLVGSGDSTFYFTVKNTSTGEYVKNGSSNVWSVSANGSTKIDELVYGTYTVTETDSKGNPVSSNSQGFAYKVTNGNTTAVINKQNKEASVTITNTSFVPTSVQFNAKKTVDDGVPATDEVFNFTLKKWNGSSWQDVESVKNVKSDITFSKIDYSMGDEGTYYYLISESGINVKEGYSYDANNYIAKVVVSTDSSSNQQKAVVTYYDADSVSKLGSAISSGDVVFYDYKFKSTDIQFFAKKTVDNQVPAAGEKFSFSLKEYVGNKWTEIQNKQNDSSNVTFDKIEYSVADAGTHYYMISESGSNDNYSYDKNNYIVVVDVTKDNKMNVYATTKYYDADSITRLGSEIASSKVVFNNTVLEKPSEVTFKAVKSVDNAIPGANEKFNFRLEKWDGTNWIQVGNTVTNDRANVTFPTISYDKEDGGKTYYYRISEAGVSSNTPDGSQYSYDKTSYIATVVITNGSFADGYQQKNVVTYNKGSEVKFLGDEVAASDIIFKNYKFKPVTVPFSAVKTVDNEVPSATEVFTFNLERWNGNAWVVVDTKTNKLGKVDFDSITFTNNDEGKVYFRISEAGLDEESHYTYDQNKYIVCVDLVIDDEYVQTATVSRYDADEVSQIGSGTPQLPSESAIAFNNIKNLDDNETYFVASKTVDDRIPGPGEVFTFGLEEYKDGKWSTIDSVENNTSGVVEFNSIKYKKDDIGEHYYRISESGLCKDNTKATVNPNYYTYDQNKYIVKVTVTENKEFGLDIVKEYYDADDIDGIAGARPVNESAVNFKNTIKVKPGKLNLSAEKTVDDKVPGDNEVFTFTLDKWDGSKWTNITTANNKNGSITFDAIDYKLEEIGNNDYYRICESGKVSGADGTDYSYDQNAYILKVYVKLDKDYNVVPEVQDIYVGTAASTIVNGNEVTGTTDKLNSDSAILFKNTIDVIPDEVQFTASKKVDDATPADGEVFNFNLEKWNGETASWDVIDTKSNVTGTDVNNVVFDKISYTKEDGVDKGNTYFYRITESGTNVIAGYTYDTTNYVAKVVVKNTGSTQNATVTYYKSVDEIGNITELGKAKIVNPEDIIFYDYKFEPAKVSFEAVKTVDDKVPAADEVFTFTFETYDNESGSWGDAVSSTNSLGSITFPDIEYTESDSGNTYYYRIGESGMNSDQYTYDATKYIVKVVVTTDEFNKQHVEKSVYVADEIADIGKEYNKEIIFKNRKNIGSLDVVKKVFVNDEEVDTSVVSDTFKFKVFAQKKAQYINDGEVYELKAGETVTINNLWNDVYTVEEVNVDPSFTVSYNGNGVRVNLESNPTVTINNKKYEGDVEIAKLYAEGEKSTFDTALKLNAKFALFESNGTPVYFKGSGNEYSYVKAGSDSSSYDNTFYTNGSSVVIRNLPAGKSYILSEVETPDGYVTLTNSVAFSIDTDGTVSTSDSNVIKKSGANKHYLAIGVKNDRKTVSIKINKFEVDENDNPTTIPVKGAKFKLEGINDSNRVIYSKEFEVSSEDGTVVFDNLPWATYSLVESKVPDGYSVVEIAGDASERFTINGDVLNSDGTSNIEGYVVSGSSTENNIILEGNLYNKKLIGDLLLKKVGINGLSGNEEALNGVKFALVDVNGNSVGLNKVEQSIVVDGVTLSGYYEYSSKVATNETVTADGGYIYVKGLPVAPSADYSFVELAPYATKFGYKAPKNPEKQMRVVAGELQKTTVINSSIETGVEFYKVDSLNPSKRLEGATFELFYQEKENAGYASTGSTSTSSSNGKISFSGLASGKYYMLEIGQPKSYLPSDEVVYFEIPADFAEGDAIELKAAKLNGGAVELISGDSHLSFADGYYTFANEQGTGSAELYKTKKIGNTETAFAGVDFVLMKNSDKFIDKVLHGGLTEAKFIQNADGVYVYSTDSSAASTLTTDNNGRIAVDELPWGDYYFLEKETKDVTDDFIILTEEYCKENLSFVIDADHDSASFTGKAVNTIKYGKVQLVKIDSETGKKIDYVEDGFTFTFNLFDSEGNLIRENLETSAGEISADTIGELPYGSYYFEEVKAGEGYDIDPTDLSFVLNDETTDDGTKTITVTAADKKSKLGSLVIKKNAEFGETVPSEDTIEVTFALYSKTNNNKSFGDRIAAALSRLFSKSDYFPYGEYTFELRRTASGAKTFEGTCEINDLPWDEYYVVEAEAPDGLVISKDQKHFVVGAGKAHLEYEFEFDNNTAPGGAQLEKVDFTTGKTIEDYTAIFDVYKSDGSLVRSGITTSEGVARVSNLQPGSYYFVEVSAPDGYILDDTIKYEFTVKEGDNDNVIVNATKAVTGVVDGKNKSALEDNKAFNKEKPCKVVITKYKENESSGNEFNGVSFFVERQMSLFKWQKEAEGVTENNGTVEFTGLPWGTYRIVEVLPDGYNAPANTQVKKVDGKRLAYSETFVLGNNADREKKFEYGISFVDTAKKAKVTLRKTNEKTAALPGAQFELRDENDNLVESITTTDKIWTSKTLEQGKYYFVETAAPDLYSIVAPKNYEVVDSKQFSKPNGADEGFKVEKVTYDNDEVEYRYWFAISDSDLNDEEDGAVLAELGLEVKNERQTGSFGLKKVDTNVYRVDKNKGLAGAVFTLFDKNNRQVPVKAVKDGYAFDDSENAKNYSIVTAGDEGVAYVSGLPTGEYTLKEVEAPEGYVTPANATWSVLIEKDKDNTKLIESPIKNGDNFTSFTFYKKDTNGDAVEGAVFELYKKEKDANGAAIYATTSQKATSTANGLVTFDNLFEGDYYVIEKPENQSKNFAYVADNTPYYFKVAFDSNDEPLEIKLYTDEGYSILLNDNTVINTFKEASLLIKKISLSDSSKFLLGAEFTLYKDGEVTGITKRIDSVDGIKFDGLKVGSKYRLVETKAPNGYRLPEEVQNVTERENMLSSILSASSMSETVSSDFVNDQIAYTFAVTKENVNGKVAITVPNAPKEGSIILQKVDNKDSEIKLKGAKFALYQKGVLVANEKVTDDNGICEFNKLTWGKYDVVETKAPEGYPEDNALYSDYFNADSIKVGKKVAEVVIGIENNEELNVFLTGDKAIRNARIGAIELIKKDSTDDKIMPNVTFILRKDGDVSFKQVYSTNDSGRISVTDLKLGDYYFDEIVPQGYSYDEDYTKVKRVEYGDFNNYKRYPESGFISLTEENPVCGAQKPVEVINDRLLGRAKGIKVNQYGEVIKKVGDDASYVATFELYSRTEGTAWQLVKAFFSGQKDAWKVGEFSTNEDGELIITDLPFGDYYLVETGAPKGHKPMSEAINFSITKEDAEAEIDLGKIVNEEEKITLNLKKVGEDKKALAGASFALYDASNDELIENKSLDGEACNAIFEGTSEKPIRFGHRYYLKETRIPYGYKSGGAITAPKSFGFENALDGEKDTYLPIDGRYYFTPDKDAVGKTVELICMNEEGQGTVEIEKLFEGDKPLNMSGIVFTLTDDETGVSYSAETVMRNVDGVDRAYATWEELPFGNYTLKEVSVPGDISYGVSTNTKSIVLNEETARLENGIYIVTDEFVNLEDDQIKAMAKIFKMSNMDKPVAGMVFEIWRENESASSTMPYTTATTDAKGVAATKSPLPKGNYYFTEKAGEAERFGFEPSDAKYFFSINAGNGTPSGDVFVPVGRTKTNKVDGTWNISDFVTELDPIINTVELGKVKLIKKDSVTNSTLDGATFDLHVVSGRDDAIYAKGLVTANGGEIVVEDLPWGSYYFVETVPPKGYTLNSNQYDFYIGPKSITPVHEYSIENAIKLDAGTIEVEDAPYITISKRILGTNDELKGAKLKLSASDGRVIETWITDGDKKFVIGSGDKELKADETYLLEEIEAPKNYSIAKPITFKIDNSGIVLIGGNVQEDNVVVMNDAKNIVIDKFITGTQTRLANATLGIFHNGVEIESFVTDGKTSHQVEKNLTAGETYVLKETKVPAGYLKADDIVFTVDGEGKALVEGESVSTDVVKMEDKPFEVIIRKVRGNGSSFNIPGAELVIWDVDNQSSIKTVTTTDKAIMLMTGQRDDYAISDVESWESQYQVVYGVNLVQGRSYYILESKAPAGFITPELKEGLKFAYVGEFDVTLNKAADDKADVAVIKTTARNDDFRLIVNKVDSEGNVLNGTELQIVGQDYEPIEGIGTLKISDNKPFMITVLSEEEYKEAYADTYASDIATYSMVYSVALDESKPYYLVETKAPEGYAEYDKNVIGYAADGAPIYGERINIKRGVDAITTVTMEDTPLEIALSKVVANADGYDYLSKAKMQLFDATLKKVVWPDATTDAKFVENTEEGLCYKTRNKPVLFTTRKLTDAEMSLYALVVGDDANEVRLVQGHDYEWREIGSVIGYVGVEDYYGPGSGETYIHESFTLGQNDIKENRREIKLVNKKPGKLEIVGKKNWGDAPMSSRCNIKIELLAGHAGEDVNKAVKVDEVNLKPNEYVFKFENLERFDYSNLDESGDAVEFVYYLHEVMESAEVAANFNWVDKDNDLVKMADGTFAKAITFADKQTVVEYTINNFSIEKIEIPVTKKWILRRNPDGTVDTTKTYDDVTIVLLQNKVEIDSFVVKDGAKDDEGEFTHVFTELPKYDSEGKLYSYSVIEKGADPAEVETTITAKDNGYKFEVENRPIDKKFYISGEKQWCSPNSLEKPNVVIVLKRDGAEYMRTQLVNDKFSFGPLYEYNLGYGADDPEVLDSTDRKETATGRKYVYTLEELDAVTQKPLVDFTMTVDFDGTVQSLTGTTMELADGRVIGGDDRFADAQMVNTIDQNYVDLSGVKTWNDSGDASKRPTVTFVLYATDTERMHEEVDRYVMDNTKTYYEFKNLPMYDSNYQPITYTIEELPLPGYETESVATDHGVDFTNTPSMTKISKVDATTSDELPGAKLVLTKASDDSKVDEWVSTSKPHYIEGLEIGEKYVLTETEAPKGYVIASPVEFTVDKAGVVQTVVMKDDPIIGSVILTKVDKDTREALEGAEFSLYDSAGKLVNALGGAGSYEYYEMSGVTTLEVSETGTLEVTKLPYGTYYFKETKAPDGYEINKEPQYFSITQQSAEVEVTFLNERSLGSVTLTKVNSNKTKALEGATFELYSATPKTTGQAIASTLYEDVYYLYGTYVTDEDGKITVEDLPWDDYYFIETEAPEGYVLNLDVNGDPLVYTFTVDSETVQEAVIDLGSITNKEEPKPTPTPTPEVEEEVPTPPPATPPADVAGVRKLTGDIVTGVLGVRAAPTQGVLGVRVGPATGDASNIILWSLLLVASIAVVVALILQSKKKKKTNN